MAESYTKLSSTLVHSTVWRESAETRVVWITMLALADQHGEIQASIPGLADVARVTVGQCERALAVFLAPDPYSRSKTLEGRRIVAIPGGWSIVNYDLYRGLLSLDHRRALARDRQARKRERDRHDVTRDVTPSHAKSRQAVSSKQKQEAKAEATEAAEQSQSRVANDRVTASGVTDNGTAAATDAKPELPPRELLPPHGQVAQGLSRAHPTYVAAYESYRRAARNPDALDAELLLVAGGEHGPGGRAVPWDTIGRALHEMLTAGVSPLTSSAVRGFCARLMVPVTGASVGAGSPVVDTTSWPSDQCRECAATVGVGPGGRNTVVHAPGCPHG